MQQSAGGIIWPPLPCAFYSWHVNLNESNRRSLLSRTTESSNNSSNEAARMMELVCLFALVMETEVGGGGGYFGAQKPVLCKKSGSARHRAMGSRDADRGRSEQKRAAETHRRSAQCAPPNLRAQTGKRPLAASPPIISSLGETPPPIPLGPNGPAPASHARQLDGGVSVAIWSELRSVFWGGRRSAERAPKLDV